MLYHANHISFVFCSMEQWRTRPRSWGQVWGYCVVAPALFQDLMNQVMALCKRRWAVQELLQPGAALEAHIGDVILGTNNIDDHLLLLQEF